MRLALATVLTFAAAARAADDAAPVIQHTPVTFVEKDAKWIQVFARVTDQSKFYPQVFFRAAGGEYQRPIDMKAVKGQLNQFGANLPVEGAAVEYYLEAYDESGNGPGRAGSPEKPFHVDVGAPVAATRPPAQTVPPPAEPVAQRPPKRALETAAPAPARPRVWTFIVGGTGVGLLAGGLVAGLAFKSADDAYQQRLRDSSSASASLKAQYDANKSLGTKAVLLLVSGGVLLAGSAALWFLEAPKGERDEGGGIAGGVAPADGGATVALSGRF